MYDRNQGAFPLDLYYSGEMPQGPSGSVEPYHSYGYHKYYSSRPRDPEFPVATGQHPPQQLISFIFFNKILIYIYICFLLL